jgi:hypothetical protein
MQDHALRVGEELVIQGHIRLTVLAVEEDKVVFGIIDEPNGFVRRRGEGTRGSTLELWTADTMRLEE